LIFEKTISQFKLFKEKNLMIKIRVKPLLAALALVGISSPALANNMVTVPTLSGGFMVGVSGLYFVPGPVSNTVYGSHVTTILSNVATTIPTGLTPSSTIVNTALTGPYISAHSLEADPSYKWGFALHLGYVFPGTGNDVMLNWNHLNTSQEDDSLAPGINPSVTTLNISGGANVTNPSRATANNTGEFIAPFLGETDLTTGLSPELGNTAPFLVAYGRSSTQWNTVDLNFGQHLNIGGNFDLRLSGGLVWARINDELEAYYAGAGNNTATNVVSTPGSTIISPLVITSNIDAQRSNTYINEESTFRGFGPEIGFDGHYCITNTNFGFAGHLGGQMLIGTTDTDLYYLTVNSGQQSRVVTTSPIVVGPAATTTTVLGYNASTFSNYLSDSQDTRLIPEVDANLGIDYTYTFANTYAHDCNSSFVIEAGYQGRKYFNALKAFDGAVGTRLHSEDVFFHGPFLSVKFFA
jgi:Legionella pneumophila major outer membrane protein precursor